MRTLREMRKWVDNLASPATFYPPIDMMVEHMMSAVQAAHADLTDLEVRLITERVFAALTEAEIRGLYTTGSEHEWAALSVRARNQE